MQNDISVGLSLWGGLVHQVGAGLVVDACVLLLLHAVVRKGSPHRVRRGERFVVVEAIVKLLRNGSGG